MDMLGWFFFVIFIQWVGGVIGLIQMDGVISRVCCSCSSYVFIVFYYCCEIGGDFGGYFVVEFELIGVLWVFILVVDFDIVVCDDVVFFGVIFQFVGDQQVVILLNMYIVVCDIVFICCDIDQCIGFQIDRQIILFVLDSKCGSRECENG